MQFVLFFESTSLRWHYAFALDFQGQTLTLFLIGACVLTTTIWFGVNVQRRYYDPAYKNDSFKYEYGSCLYVGWVAGFFSKFKRTNFTHLVARYRSSFAE